MHSNFRKALVAAAMIGMAPPAFADVITDWNEKTVAFVTPRMVPAAGQRVVAIVQVAMFDAVNSGWMALGVEGTEHVSGTTSARDVFAAARNATTA